MSLQAHHSAPREGAACTTSHGDVCVANHCVGSPGTACTTGMPSVPALPNLGAQRILLMLTFRLAEIVMSCI